MNETKSEHITRLFMIAMYHWYIGDKFNARNAIKVAIYIANAPDLAQA